MNLNPRAIFAPCLALCCAVMLSACVAPALLLAPQSQLMWALLKPMVGLDPKQANLFKQPLIQSRLQPLLGEHYDTAVQLLETADKIQQEGPLFYVVSKYTPVPQLAEKAGFVWNSETNRMAVLLVSGGAPQIFAEKLNETIAEQVPVWPADLSDYTDPAKLKLQAIKQAQANVINAVPVPAAIAPLADKAQQIHDYKTHAENVVSQKTEQLTQKVLAPLTAAQQAAQEQVQQVQQSVTDQMMAPVTSDQQAAQQEVQQIQQSVTDQVQAPVTFAQQAAQQQVEQVQQSVTDQVQAPVTSAQQAAQQQVEQVQQSVTDQMQAPVTSAQQAAHEHVQQVQQSVSDQVQSPVSAAQQEAKQYVRQTIQTAVTAEVQSTDSDDLAAELAAEQASVSEQRQLHMQKLLGEISATQQQLQQPTSPAEVLVLKQRLQQLEAQLQQLQAQEAAIKRH